MSNLLINPVSATLSIKGLKLNNGSREALKQTVQDLLTQIVRIDYSEQYQSEKVGKEIAENTKFTITVTEYASEVSQAIEGESTPNDTPIDSLS